MGLSEVNFPLIQSIDLYSFMPLLFFWIATQLGLAPRNCPTLFPIAATVHLCQRERWDEPTKHFGGMSGVNRKS